MNEQQLPLQCTTGMASDSIFDFLKKKNSCYHDQNECWGSTCVIHDGLFRQSLNWTGIGKNDLYDIMQSLPYCIRNGTGTGLEPALMAHQAIVASFLVTMYSNLSVSWSQSHCQCENFSTILFPAPVPFKFCMNKLLCVTFASGRLYIYEMDL